MRGTIGYKQTKEYFNSVPQINSKIDDLSEVSTSYYDPKAPKTNDIKAFLKRPVRYHFAMTEKKPGSVTLFHHSCYFDNKDEALKAHQRFKLQVYDQRVSKYLNKINEGKQLSVVDQIELLNIINSPLFSK